MDYPRNEELIHWKQEIIEICSPVHTIYPDLFEEIPDFSHYSSALSYSKAKLLKFSEKLQSLHKIITENRYGQQFLKIAQDLAQFQAKFRNKVSFT